MVLTPGTEAYADAIRRDERERIRSRITDVRLLLADFGLRYRDIVVGWTAAEDMAALVDAYVDRIIRAVLDEGGKG